MTIDEYLENGITQYLVFEHTNVAEPLHSRFTDAEIKLLWSKLYEVNNVDIILIYIYTGMRPTESLNVLTENVHVDEKYMVGGMKTEAGKDQVYTQKSLEKLLVVVNKN